MLNVKSNRAFSMLGFFFVGGNLYTSVTDIVGTCPLEVARTTWKPFHFANEMNL